jgi:hypothetical protein
MEEKNERREN